MDTKLHYLLSMKRPNFDRKGRLGQTTWLPAILSLMPAQTRMLKNADGEVMALLYQQPSDADAMLFCSHLDTVHQSLGIQELDVTEHLVTAIDSECLGADDGAGVWLMLEMIAAGVPGSYLFHLQEEIGCRGSSWMRRTQHDFLSQFPMVVGFDRPYCSDVVTHLCGQPACDVDFAYGLSEALSMDLPDGYWLSPSENGGATDVMHYIGVIPQCTNISVGYQRQHTCRESLDLRYLESLRNACIKVFPEMVGVPA